ncbi:MAG TPA: arginase family protein [Polyangiaceae bacterium]|nr:arginase family protein [Polyangiaceae bacterium]
MTNRLSIVGAPSSAGAYAPGQEQAPAALREIGFLRMLTERGIRFHDRGDVAGFRWRPDKANPSAMNVGDATRVARAVSQQVAAALADRDRVLVIGGDCTVELGTVSGALQDTTSVGVVYIDLDTDLNTPESTSDGALDWMGVAHLLAIPGSLAELAGLGPRTPMLTPGQVLFFASDNVEPFERDLITTLGIDEVGLAEVQADPAGAAEAVVNGWARQFERLLVHVDIDVLDYADTPLAENTRRNWGLRCDQLMQALNAFLKAPNWTALTICELNPDHGESDGATLRPFGESLADALRAPLA